MKKLFIASTVVLFFSAVSFADDLVTFEPKLKGMTQKQCEDISVAAKTLYEKVSTIQINLQKTSEENQDLYKELIESQVSKITKRIHDLCFKVNL
jgi:UDP-N-acetylmuramyl pentapeptide phosphotransferase/UDP-N-acetylglucosamine-1-phosphate transferase